MKSVMIIVLALPLSQCFRAPDAGCLSYGEARLAMPNEQFPVDEWGNWIADTDDRMTGTCRGT